MPQTYNKIIPKLKIADSTETNCLISTFNLFSTLKANSKTSGEE